MLPPAEQKLWIEFVTSRGALVKTTMEVHDLERKLAAAARLPQNDKDRVKQITQEIEDLRRQLAHLKELSEAVAEYNQSQLGMSNAGKAHRDVMAASAVAHAQSREWAVMKSNLAAPVGSLRGRRVPRSP